MLITTDLLIVSGFDPRKTNLKLGSVYKKKKSFFNLLYTSQISFLNLLLNKILVWKYVCPGLDSDNAD